MSHWSCTRTLVAQTCHLIVYVFKISDRYFCYRSVQLTPHHMLKLELVRSDAEFDPRYKFNGPWMTFDIVVQYE